MSETSEAGRLRGGMAPVREWEDPPERGRTADDWPYPDRHEEFEVTGELAQRIRSRFGIKDDAIPVYLDEVTMSGGYSEWTQENDYMVTARCGDAEWTSLESFEANGLVQVLAWLDEDGTR